MSIKNFLGSVKLILRNKNIQPAQGVWRHIKWQFRKVLNRFPHQQVISQSLIIAAHKRCSVSGLINSQGTYDYNNMHLIQDLLRPGGVFFDVGANIGSYALVASEVTGGQVVAFEPHPYTYDLLCKNLALNARANVKAYPYAVSDRNGNISLTNDPGSSVNYITQTGENSVEVPTVRLDTFCREHELAPDYMKIDVEGFECGVLVGCGDRLRDIKVLFVEINGLSDARSQGQQQILNVLAENDFLGPLYFDYKNKSFSTVKAEPPEDSIFLAKHFIDSDRFRREYRMLEHV